MYTVKKALITPVVKELMAKTGKTWRELYKPVSKFLHFKGVMKKGNGTKFGSDGFHFKKKTCETCKSEFHPTSLGQRFCFPCNEDTGWCAHYGITVADYKAMWEKQHGRCAICTVDLKTLSQRAIHIDHCHKTATVRGIVCRTCNHRLAVVDDESWCELANVYRSMPGIKPRCECGITRDLRK